jgi:hypothetical protein
MNEHEFEHNGYQITTYVYDGDPERLKELWIEANGEYIGCIRFRGLVPTREQVEANVDEYFSDLVLGYGE